MSKKYQISGVVSAITRNEGTTKKNEPWKAIEFVVTESGEYPNSVKMKVYKDGDNLKHLPTLTNGDTVDTEFNLKAKEYNGKYYLEANAWTVKVTTPTQHPVSVVDDESDLPF